MGLGIHGVGLQAAYIAAAPLDADDASPSSRPVGRTGVFDRRWGPVLMFRPANPRQAAHTASFDFPTPIVSMALARRKKDEFGGGWHRPSDTLSCWDSEDRVTLPAATHNLAHI